MEDWSTAPGGIRYRLEGGGVRVTLPEGQAMVAEADRLLYREDGVSWSLAGSGAGRMRGWVNRIQRRAAGLADRMSRYDGPGEVAFAAGATAEVEPVELVKGDNLVVAAPTFLAAAVGVQVDVALVEKVREEGERRTLAMYRLIGEGLALLAASGDAVRMHLRPDEAVEAAAWAIAWYEATGSYELRVLGGPRGNHVARIAGPACGVAQTARPPVR